MPRKTFKMLMPSPATLRRYGSISILGDWIYEGNLWHINRYSTSMAFFVGLFLAFMPIPGQIPLAALAAVVLRCNLPLSVGLVFTTNPLTAPPIFYLAYQVGALLMDTPLRELQFDFSLTWLLDQLEVVWRPLLLGCLVCGLFFGSLGYFVVNMLWRVRVVRRWRRRRRAQGS